MVGADKRQPLTKRLGTYEIIRPLAKGGMAELFLARATGPEGFEKVLVLKKILAHHAENPRWVRAFLDEAKLVAGFDHPHIAHVHDMGTADGAYFFTMEFVHGVDVRTMVKRYKRDHTPVPFEVAVMIVRDIASALHYAHERRGSDGKLLNVVHRDVSPSNIIVSYDGVPKLIDFGIAKATSSSLKTQTGALKGKISYMSPEQAKGLPIDRRTDVYALGILLWELIASVRLYKSPNDMATIQQIINVRAPSPRDYRRECPEALVKIVMRALELKIDERYQTAQELQLALEDFALENKLKQSTIVLSTELRKRFNDELKIWEHAQTDPQTVTDCIAVPPVDDDDEEDSLAEPPPDDDDDAPPTVTTLPVAPEPEPVFPVMTPAAIDVVAPPPPRRKRTRMIAIALGAAAIIGVALAVTTHSSSKSAPAAAPIESEPEPAKVEVAAPEPTKVEPVPAPEPTKVEPVAAPEPAKVEPVAVPEPAKVEPVAAPEPAKVEPVAAPEPPAADIEMGAERAKATKKTKPAKKATAKSKSKPEIKAKVESPKPEVKAKVESKPEVKAKPEPPKPEVKAKPEPPKPEVSKPEPKPEPKPKPKFDPNAVFPPSS